MTERLAQLTKELAELPSPEPDERWLNNLAKWRAALCTELLQIRSPIRDRAVKELSDNLMFSIKLIDFGFGVGRLGPIVRLTGRLGELMKADGYEVEAPGLYGPNGWRGSEREVERRLKDLKQRRESAQSALDAATRDVVALHPS